MFNVIHVIFTVHLVTCEHSVAHLQCGKIMFLFFLCMVHYYQKHKQFIFNFYGTSASALFLCYSCSFRQMLGRLFMSMVLTMDAATRPHAHTNGLPLRSKILTVQTRPTLFLTGTPGHFLSTYASCLRPWKSKSWCILLKKQPHFMCCISHSNLRSHVILSPQL